MVEWKQFKNENLTRYFISVKGIKLQIKKPSRIGIAPGYWYRFRYIYIFLYVSSYSIYAVTLITFIQYLPNFFASFASSSM